jgi:hypothetical protein
MLIIQCYPKNINYSRCCDKPICTDCFLQIKRSEDSPQTPTACPYCVHSHFGVIHIPPKWSINYPVKYTIFISITFLSLILFAALEIFEKKSRYCRYIRHSTYFKAQITFKR